MRGNEADLHNVITAENALDIAAITTDTTTLGDIIDMKDKLALDFLVQSGTLTDGAYVVKLEDGDDSGLGDAADIPAANLLGALPAFALSEDNVVKRVGFFKRKRFVRLSIVSTATSTGGTLGAIAVVNPALTE